MESNEQENYDSTNEAEETVNNEVEEVEEVEDDSDLQAELEALRKENMTLKIQKQKAREKASEAPKAKAVSSNSEGDLSSRDLFALIEAKVPENDIDDVREYAQLKGISIREALASNVVKTILSDNAEQRQSASVANVGSTKRASGKLSDEALVERAKRGEMPESQEDLRRLIMAQKKRK